MALRLEDADGDPQVCVFVCCLVSRLVVAIDPFPPPLAIVLVLQEQQQQHPASSSACRLNVQHEMAN